jgi:hypothetical protein
MYTTAYSEKITIHLTADGKDRENIERVTDVYADSCPAVLPIGP